LVEGKIVAAVLSHNASEGKALLEFQREKIQREKHCWSYFAVRRIRLLGLVK